MGKKDVEDAMARKRQTPSRSGGQKVTAKRAARLYQLLQLLGTGPQTRAALMRRLRVDVRGFYRDLVLLRKATITVRLEKGRYTLQEPVQAVVGKLPFPDPGLSFAEALQLAKGRTRAHHKLKEQIRQIIG
jgi:predicted DNA-binding transcriptional regulator YafY